MRTIIKLALVSTIAAAASAVGAAPAPFEDTTVLIIAKNGADDPPGDIRHGRGGDNPAGDVRRAQRADDPAGDTRHGRGRDNPARDIRRSQGADDPAGDMRRGRGRDDPPNHG